MFESPRLNYWFFVVKAVFSKAAFLKLVMLISGASSLLVNATEVLDIPSITATKITRDTRTGEVISSDWIQLSSDGLRARQSGSEASFEYLQNFSQEKLWMMDWSRKILLEASPDEENLIDQNDANAAVEPFVAVVGEVPQSSVLTAVPCINLVAVKVGIAKWREQDVAVWRCEFAGGEHYSEVFFSQLWGLVIREERIDQTIIELSNIRQAEFSAGHFTPPTYFRKTDFRELIIGSPEIGSYSE
ncbi:MAG: hypothetical protein V3U65_11430 [Granulosicoccaceae bacterium]